MQRRLKTRWWFYAVVPSVVVLAPLIAAELALRTFWPIPHGVDRNMFFASDPFTGYRIQPNSVGYFRDGIIARANSRGHRDDEVSLARREGVPRILVLGDSFTVGASVLEEHAYPHVLQGLLGEERGGEVEVINTGVGGWDPYQYAQYFEHYGRVFAPDLVLIGFFVGNDSYSPYRHVRHLPTAIGGRRVSQEAAAKLGVAFKVALYERSHLWRLLSTPATAAPGATVRRRDCADFSKRYLVEQRDRLKVHLEEKEPGIEERLDLNVGQIQRIVDLAGEDGTPVLVALFPDENQLNPALRRRLRADRKSSRYDFSMPQPVLAERLTAIGAEVLDFLPVFAADSRCLFLNDTHWTEEGHVLVAEALRDWLSGRVGAGPP